MSRRTAVSLKTVTHLRAAQRREATLTVALAETRYVIVTQDAHGKPRHPTSQDLLWNGRCRMREAEARKGELEALNPGKTFVILCR